MPSCLFFCSPPACDTRTQIVEEADTGKVKCVDKQPDLIGTATNSIRWKVPSSTSVGGVSGLKFTSWKIWFNVVAWPPSTPSLDEIINFHGWILMENATSDPNKQILTSKVLHPSFGAKMIDSNGKIFCLLVWGFKCFLQGFFCNAFD